MSGECDEQMLAFLYGIEGELFTSSPHFSGHRLGTLAARKAGPGKITQGLWLGSMGTNCTCNPAAVVL
jgi:hypothetical protein